MICDFVVTFEHMIDFLLKKFVCVQSCDLILVFVGHDFKEVSGDGYGELICGANGGVLLGDLMANRPILLRIR